MAKILIVDDEIIFVELVGTMLKTHGYEVIVAYDGVEGLEKAENESPDLIVLDIIMPKMDGFTMLKEVRKNKKICDMPVVLCTGKAQKDYVEVSQKIGANAYLTKPIKPEEFLTKIEELLK